MTPLWGWQELIGSCLVTGIILLVGVAVAPPRGRS
jgi:hypothetical protein